MAVKLIDCSFTAQGEADSAAAAALAEAELSKGLEHPCIVKVGREGAAAVAAAAERGADWMCLQRRICGCWRAGICVRAVCVRCVEAGLHPAGHAARAILASTFTVLPCSTTHLYLRLSLSVHRPTTMRLWRRGRAAARCGWCSRCATTARSSRQASGRGVGRGVGHSAVAACCANESSSRLHTLCVYLSRSCWACSIRNVVSRCPQPALPVPPAVDRGWMRKKRSLTAPPDMRAMLTTLREIAAGMAFLHAQDVLHCDLTGGLWLGRGCLAVKCCCLEVGCCIGNRLGWAARLHPASSRR